MKLYMLGVPILLIAMMTADDCYKGALELEQTTSTSAGLDAITYAGTTSNDALVAWNQANELREEALSAGNLRQGNSMSFKEIDAAIAKLPGEGEFYLDKAAMLVMQGRAAEVQTNLAKARGIYEDAFIGAPAGDGTMHYRDRYISALARARRDIRQDSPQWKKLTDEICAQWKALPVNDRGQKTIILPSNVPCR